MPTLRFCPLYSGSSGNALYVEYGQTRLLIDAGKSGRCIEEALAFIGVDPDTLSGILVTHEHSDHIAGVGILARRHHLPVWANAGTWGAMGKKLGKLTLDQQQVFDSGCDFYIGDLGVQPFAIPHDAAEPVGYRIWAGGASLSTATDLGYFPDRVRDALAGSDLVLLESNHDPVLLGQNPHYSALLKRRILSRNGHLSNEASAEAMIALAETGTRAFILGHLSGENNTPELALRTAETRAELEGMTLGEDIHIDLAWRDRVGGVYSIEAALPT